mmetsp:Transcript_20002/g.62109  ORF Transcript_20002/g.62109 Transcript_20002/m.62109 type:complete len:222 (-) Transcript_20002:1376-2041(-)
MAVRAPHATCHTIRLFHVTSVVSEPNKVETVKRLFPKIRHVGTDRLRPKIVGDEPRNVGGRGKRARWGRVAFCWDRATDRCDTEERRAGTPGGANTSGSALSGELRGLRAAAYSSMRSAYGWKTLPQHCMSTLLSVRSSMSSGSTNCLTTSGIASPSGSTAARSGLMTKVSQNCSTTPKRILPRTRAMAARQSRFITSRVSAATRSQCSAPPASSRRVSKV